MYFSSTMDRHVSTNLISDPRVEPQQRRAQQRIDAILRATEILLERGDDVTTSSIAVQAGIPVGSIYRYFPNVLGIYRSLFEDLNGQLREQFATIVSDAGSDKSWHVLFEEILASAIELYVKHPGYGNLLFTMSAPALQDVRQDCIDKTSVIFAQRWREGHDGFHGGDVDHVASTASKLFTFIEQCYFEQDTHAGSMLFIETLKALKAYLSIYLEP